MANRHLLLNKGQIALEFLVNYGWAILIVIVVIAALSYMGVFNPILAIPNHCIMPMGISCLDYKVSSNDIEVSVKNSFGYDLSGLTVAAAGCGTSNTVARLDPGQQAKFIIPCTSALAGTKYAGRLNLTYTKSDTGVSHNGLGEITTRIQ